MGQRAWILVATAAITSALFLLTLYRTPRGIIRGVGLSDQTAPLANGSTAAGNGSLSATSYVDLLSQQQGPTILTPDTPKHAMPKTVLVLATMSDTDNSWVKEDLGDLLEGDLGTAFYVTDDITAPLHTPYNKGHEAMAYLSYMIDFYDNLPEISIFLHGHREAWHNNYLLEMSTSLIVRRLNHEKVARDGYMNLRCHWNPGCPNGLDPMATKLNKEAREEIEIKDAWESMFPFDPLPEKLAQPCCSQFATTRERIRALPRERYVQFRTWLIETELDDYINGRIFEYFWQVMLNSSPVFCPDPRTCYCDGFGVCFEDPAEYEEYFGLATKWQSLDKSLAAWKAYNTAHKGVSKALNEKTQKTSKRGQESAPVVGNTEFDSRFRDLKEVGNRQLVAWKEYKQMHKRGEVEGVEEEEKLDPNVVDKWDRGDWLQYDIDKTLKAMWILKEKALAAGRDPERKVAALRAAEQDPFEPPEYKRVPWWV